MNPLIQRHINLLSLAILSLIITGKLYLGW